MSDELEHVERMLQRTPPPETVPAAAAIAARNAALGAPAQVVRVPAARRWKTWWQVASGAAAPSAAAPEATRHQPLKRLVRDTRITCAGSDSAAFRAAIAAAAGTASGAGVRCSMRSTRWSSASSFTGPPPPAASAPSAGGRYGFVS